MLAEFDTSARAAIERLGWMPDWAVSLIVFAAALLAAVLVHRVIFRVLTRVVEHRDLFWRSLVQRGRRPARLAFLVFALSVAAGVAPLTSNQNNLVQHLLLVAFIALLGWLSGIAIGIWSTLYLRHYQLDVEDNLLARKHTTQMRILQRVGMILIVVVTVAAMLMTFDQV
ncbi:MAG TPA: mechanosensitive ion channel family protein, partial [Alphaproteobacteria bacterium]|nr:mechanosensitive ion channel family protein [Alphaproteobacteria bacterium]